jgi:hypothetical protein
MAVPFIFSTVPGGSSIPLANLDANFSYLTTSPVFAGNVAIGGTLSVTGATTITGLTTLNGGLTLSGPFTINGITVSPTGTTGTGNLVFSNTPTLVTPILGTPTSGNLTNCTGYPIGQITGLAAGVLPFLTNPTCANLGAAVVDETGTGNLVFSNNPNLSSPNMTAPILGTPASGNLSLCTGYPAPSLSGVVQVANGGTGMSTTGAVGDSLVVTAPGVLGYSAAPPSSSVAGGAASQILYQSAPNTTAFIPNGTIGQTLVSNGAAAPAWGQLNLTAAVAGILPIANGGTGSSTQQSAINNLAGSVTSGSYLRGNGTNVVMSPILLGDITALGTLSNNTSGTAAGFTSITQNSQFNSIGVGVVPSGAAGQINATGNIVTTAAAIVSTGVTFNSGTTQTDSATGYGQSWQNLTASRAYTTIYTNTTTKPIFVIVSFQSASNADAIEFQVNGVIVWHGQTNTPGGNYYEGLSVIVPPGGTYQLVAVGPASGIKVWAELR